jgi:hypothetical protein
MAVAMKAAVYWEVTPCNLVDGYQKKSSTQMIEAARYA